MNRILFSVALLMVTASAWGQGDIKPSIVIQAPATKEQEAKYRKWLLSMGAIPASELSPWTKKPTPRMNVRGWIAPNIARQDSYVTKETREKYGLSKKSLTNEQFLSFLAIEEYQTNRSDDLYAAMQFALDSIGWAKPLTREQSKRLAEVYDAKLGLRVRLERAQLTQDEWLALYRKHDQDTLLLELAMEGTWTPTLLKELEKWVSAPKGSRLGQYRIFNRLYKHDPVKYRPALWKFLASKPKLTAQDEKEWCTRRDWYEAQLAHDTPHRWESIRHALLNDPTSETREGLLGKMREHPESVEHVQETAKLLAEGNANPSRPETALRRRSESPARSALTYLKWAKRQPKPMKPKGIWSEWAKKDGLAMRACFGTDKGNSVTANTKMPVWGQLKNVSKKPLVICTKNNSWTKSWFFQNEDNSFSGGGEGGAGGRAYGLGGFPFRVLKPNETYVTGLIHHVDIAQAKSIWVTITYTQGETYRFHEHHGRGCQFPKRKIENCWVGSLKAKGPSLDIVPAK